ncbi:Lipid II flippase FtsW [candidate division SR1 bacterium Aalborg_AAW-1]|nr:Lipid II flippase FtsW [candidate division SR1 bacterium Aalborg_AAW-1]
MPLLIVTGLLLLYGILALFSVSVHESFTTTLSLIAKGTFDGEASNYFYFFKQLNNLIYVAVLAYIAYITPLKIFKNEKFLIFVSVIVLIFQLLVFTPLGTTLGGARGWLNIPGLPSIQPVEFFKIGYVIFISRWFIRKEHLLNSGSILKKFFVLNALLFLIFALIPDLGSVLIMAITGVIIGVYAGISIKNIARMFLIGAGGLGLVIRGFLGLNNSYCKEIPLNERPSICRYTYIANRIEVYINPDSDESGQNASRQGRQALIAIGGGGFFGNGYGKGLQKFGYIPEAQSDFIFSAYAEEVGFFGISILFILYGLLIYYTVIKIGQVRDNFFKYISIGLLSLIIVGAFVHIGVNIQLLPNTGLTLPFISYGGTSLMANVVSVILLYKILYLDPHKTY